MGGGGALKKTLDDFTGKDGYPVDPRLFSSSSSGKFSNVTPGIKPETYLGKAAPSGREQDWEQTKIFGEGELRNPPSLIETVKSAFGVGKKSLSPPGSREFEKGTRTSLQHAATEFEGSSLEGGSYEKSKPFNNPLARLGFFSLMKRNPERLYKIILPMLGDIPPKIKARLFKQLTKKGMTPKDFAAKLKGIFDELGGAHGTSWRIVPGSATEQYLKAQGTPVKDRTLYEIATGTASGATVIDRPEIRSRYQVASTFLHELIHEGANALLEAKDAKHVFRDIIPASRVGSFLDRNEQLAYYAQVLDKDKRRKAFGFTRDTLRSELKSERLKSVWDETEARPQEKYAESPRGIHPEQYHRIMKLATKELGRLEKDYYDSRGILERLGDWAFGSKGQIHKVEGWNETVPKVPEASKKRSKKYMQSLPITEDVLWRGGREKRLEQEKQNIRRDKEYKQSRTDRVIGEAEAKIYTNAPPEERQELDAGTPIFHNPNIINLPKKRRGGTVKKRYAKGGGIRKPKGF